MLNYVCRMIWIVQNLSCNVIARPGLFMDFLQFHLRPFPLSNSRNIETVKATESLVHSNWSFLNVNYKPHQVFKIILRMSEDIIVHMSFFGVAAKKATTTFQTLGKTDSGEKSEIREAILRQVACQNIPKGKAGKWAKQWTVWGLFQGLYWIDR